MRKALLALLVLVGVWCAPAWAATPQFPVLSGRVVDAANILSPAAETQLTADLANFEQRSAHQFVVVTLPSLQGYEIEDYGYQLGRHWGIGRKDKNDGVLLIVAPNERRVRIEVGYGLEGDLTDSTANAIIQNIILPDFKRGNMESGIIKGAQATIAIFNGEHVVAVSEPDAPWMVVFIVGLILAFFFFNFTRTVLYLLLMPFAWWLRSEKPWLFDTLEEGRKKVFQRLRKWPIPLFITLPIWVILPVFFSGNVRFQSGGGPGSGGGFGGGGSSGGGFSGGGGSFGGGGSSGRW